MSVRPLPVKNGSLRLAGGGSARVIPPATARSAQFRFTGRNGVGRRVPIEIWQLCAVAPAILSVLAGIMAHFRGADRAPEERPMPAPPPAKRRRIVHERHTPHPGAVNGPPTAPSRGGGESGGTGGGRSRSCGRRIAGSRSRSRCSRSRPGCCRPAIAYVGKLIVDAVVAALDAHRAGAARRRRARARRSSRSRACSSRASPRAQRGIDFCQSLLRALLGAARAT